MTRALMVEGGGNLWGSERALLDLLYHLGDMEVAVCCPRNTPLHVELVRRGVRVLPWFVDDLHRRPRWRRLQATLGVIAACIAFRPNLLHLNQCGILRVAGPAARLFRLPMTAHLRIFEEVGYLARLAREARRLRGLILISKAVQKAVAASSALSRIPQHQLYDGYTPAPAGEAIVRDRDALVCAGRIEPAKGQSLLIEALGLMDRPNVVCHFAGDGSPELVRDLKLKAESAGLTGVRWQGFITDMPALLRQSAILAFPSELETLGRVIFEAWDAGAVPVVFAGSGGAAEIVAAADGGVIYEVQTAQALAEALERALSLSDGERDRLAANGRAWMAANCDPRVCGARTAAIWSAAIAERST